MNNKRGFTLIEMIGVLAIIAVLVGSVAPRIFETIKKSKVTTAATLVKTLRGAISGYYADMGTIMPFEDVTVTTGEIKTGTSNSGVYNESLEGSLAHIKTASQTTGLWKFFKGPYIESFNNDGPPLGTSMSIYTISSTSSSAGVGNLGWRNYDLDETGGAGDDISEGSQVASLVIKGASKKQWEDLEAIMNEKSIDAEKGKIKYSTSGDIFIYLVHN